MIHYCSPASFKCLQISIYNNSEMNRNQWLLKRHENRFQKPVRQHALAHTYGSQQILILTIHRSQFLLISDRSQSTKTASWMHSSNSYKKQPYQQPEKWASKCDVMFCFGVFTFLFSLWTWPYFLPQGKTVFSRHALIYPLNTTSNMSGLCVHQLVFS